MAGKVATMDVRLLAAVSGSLTGVNVTRLCADRGVSRKTFYRWRARYRAEGLAGLEPRSRRPRRSSQTVTARLEERIITLRKTLAEDGLDYGPGSIRYRLAQESEPYLPSEATIWRLLRRRGFVVPSPKKRPRSSLRRFEAEVPNQLWQIDATTWRLADGTEVVIFNLIDDHSRLVVSSMAAPAETTQAAWEAFSLGVSRYGPPSGCLSDNGLAFSGRLRGFEVRFEVNLRTQGIRAITSSPHHPQTTGKVERFNQTLKKWLRAQKRATSLAELQTQLDAFVDYYNHRRPHRGIGGLTPSARFDATEKKAPADTTLPAPQRQTEVVVSPNGAAQLKQWDIGVGMVYAGKQARVVTDGTWASVYIEGTLIRHLRLDPTRRYQPTGRKPGRPPKPRPA